MRLTQVLYGGLTWFGKGHKVRRVTSMMRDNRELKRVSARNVILNTCFPFVNTATELGHTKRLWRDAEKKFDLRAWALEQRRKEW